MHKADVTGHHRSLERSATRFLRLYLEGDIIDGSDSALQECATKNTNKIKEFNMITNDSAALQFTLLL